MHILFFPCRKFLFFYNLRESERKLYSPNINV